MHVHITATWLLIAKVFFEVSAFDHCIAVHFCYSKSLVDKTNAILKSYQLLISHDIGIYLFAKQIHTLFCHIEFVHA